MWDEKNTSAFGRYRPQPLTAEQLQYKLKLAQQMRRYDEMTLIIQELYHERGALFGLNECALVNVAYTEALRSRRKAWMALEDLEGQEEGGGRRREHQVEMVSAYRRHIEKEITKLCGEVFPLVNRILDPAYAEEVGDDAAGASKGVEAGGAGESEASARDELPGTSRSNRSNRSHQSAKSSSSSSSSSSSRQQQQQQQAAANLGSNPVVPLDAAGRGMCLCLLADCHRAMAETLVGEEHRDEVDRAQRKYEEATAAMDGLPVTHARRLSVALNFAAFTADVVKNLEKACKMAKRAFDEAAREHPHVEDKAASDACYRIMLLLRENLRRWTTDEDVLLAGGSDPLT
eukprot:g3298.t1